MDIEREKELTAVMLRQRYGAISDELSQRLRSAETVEEAQAAIREALDRTDQLPPYDLN